MGDSSEVKQVDRTAELEAQVAALTGKLQSSEAALAAANEDRSSNIGKLQTSEAALAAANEEIQTLRSTLQEARQEASRAVASDVAAVAAAPVEHPAPADVEVPQVVEEETGKAQVESQA